MAPYPPDAKPLPSKDLCNKDIPNPIRGKGPLEKGDSRKDLVEQLQKMLEFLEYSCGPQGVDGIFGDNTRKAVLKFQSEHKDYEEKGLRQDGKVGPRTSDALNRCLVGKWFGKWLTPKDFITKDKDIREKFLLLTITQEELKKGEALDTTPEKEAEEIKKARVAIVDYVFEEVTLGIGLTPVERDWLPDARNVRIRFMARIYAQKEGKWIYPGKKRRIIFRLDSSREIGVCMNYPPTKEIPCRNKAGQTIRTYSGPYASTNPDLFFANDDPGMAGYVFDKDLKDDANPTCPTTIISENDNPAHEHHYQIAKTGDMLTEATVIVRCEDFGAYGYLEAFIDDGKELPPPAESDPMAWDALEVSEKKVKVKIPWDKNGNDIADTDKAPQDGNGADPATDSDADPASDSTGDGLTNFEEYRGFIVKGSGSNSRQHVRTDITIKDIFIHDRDNIGTGYFSQTNLKIWLLPGCEFYDGDSADHNTSGPDEGTQTINFNQTPEPLNKGKKKYGGKQHGLRLVSEQTLNSHNRPIAGKAFGSGPGIPGVTNRVAVNMKDLQDIWPNTFASRFDNSKAHELGHGINMFHHGQLPRCTSHGANQKIDPLGGTGSGDTSCVMRYWGDIHGWCHTNPNPPPVHCLHAVNPANDAPGTTYCTSVNATGGNVVTGHRNNAIRGNCRKQLKVKDWT